MGTIVVGSEGPRVTLAARSFAGRSRACLVRTTDTQVSGEHACIYWHDAGWMVRDLGSTNGTWIRAERLAPGERRSLARGDRVCLGAADGFDFVLTDCSPPIARAVALDSGVVREAAFELLHLPSDDEPLLTVFYDGRWVGESDGDTFVVCDQQVVSVANREWRLELPDQTPGERVVTTATAGHDPVVLERCRLEFRVSRDEEFATLSLSDAGREHVLAARSFHYTLLTLARRRIDDAGRGVDPADQGWIYADDLARMLGTTKPKVNLDVCRARQQLAAAGVLGAGRIIERRSSSQQLRIGVAALAVRLFEG